jgi:hypothetical protein
MASIQYSLKTPEAKPSNIFWAFSANPRGPGNWAFFSLLFDESNCFGSRNTRPTRFGSAAHDSVAWRPFPSERFGVRPDRERPERGGEHHAGLVVLGNGDAQAGVVQLSADDTVETLTVQNPTAAGIAVVAGGQRGRTPNKPADSRRSQRVEPASGI